MRLALWGAPNTGRGDDRRDEDQIQVEDKEKLSITGKRA